MTRAATGRAYAIMAAAVAVAIAAPGLRNGFALDDTTMVVGNLRVVNLQSPLAYFSQSYWPGGGLYRPVTVLALALLWKAGDGSPALFHLANLALNALVTVLVYRLGRRLLGAPMAALAALIFAVHPVHVEAVANVVGVSELICAAALLGATLLLLRGLEGDLGPTLRLAVVGLCLVGALAKEQGFVAPALLVVVSMTVAPARASLRRSAPTVVALSALLAAVIVLRLGVLGGLAGQDPIPPLQGLSGTERVLVSLGTVPSWIRLLLWPSALSFDYSPPGFVLHTTLSAVHVVSLGLLLALGWLAWRCRVRAPAVTLGIAWTAITILPVSNLLFPTGILLAERTLYLPSIGTALALAGLAEVGWQRMALPAVRRAALAACGIVLVCGAVRSASRARVWASTASLLSQTPFEAADNYRAHRGSAYELDRAGRLGEAEQEYRKAIALWPRDGRTYQDLAILLHRQGRDTAAITVLKAGLAVDPAAPTMRSKLYFIQAGRREWPEARATALAGAEAGDTAFVSLVKRADSAMAMLAPSPSPVP